MTGGGSQPAMEPQMLELVTALRARRLMLGMTQREIAERLGCAQTLVSMWEKGRRGLSFNALTAWAEVLGGEVEVWLTFPPIEATVTKTTLRPRKN